MTNTPHSPYDSSPYGPPPRIHDGASRRRRRDVWTALGVALAVTLGVLGLMIVAGGVIFVIGLNNYGSNK